MSRGIFLERPETQVHLFSELASYRKYVSGKEPSLPHKAGKHFEALWPLTSKFG